ncbi:hypothetical protein [Pseudonocardia parietis]|uniref:MFS family permease n=1 Tax=Pseudonocardia parietis TaxID=570936 RepID=A0ABS4W5Z4_9PSEU|nr:hypothetical protein [Pseudonocardia parietis]MBP2371632.1 MFS family permease [Pseudonocardia parietis]
MTFGIGVTVTLSIFGFAYGPAGAYLPELFRSHYRYTGAGMAQSFAGIAGGAIPPLFAAWLAAMYGSWAIGVFLAVVALISMFCVLALHETRSIDLADASVEKSENDPERTSQA